MFIHPIYTISEPDDSSGGRKEQTYLFSCLFFGKSVFFFSIFFESLGAELKGLIFMLGKTLVRIKKEQNPIVS